MTKKILIAVDHGPMSETVAQYGFQLGNQLGAEMALVSVVDTEYLMTDGGVTTGEMIEMMKNDFVLKQKTLVEKVFGEKRVDSFIEEGKPFLKILQRAQEWESEMIILGTHGRKGLSHLLMGSVAEKVVRHAHIPLVIIPVK